MEGIEYLSPRALGRAVGLSESSVRRWADEGRLRAERTAGGHRRISRAEAVRFIRDTGLELLRPDLLGFPHEARSGEVSIGDALLDALAQGNALAARRMLVSAFLDGTPLATLCDGPIRLALREMGTLWRQGADGIVYEHRAVDTCLHALMEIRSTIPERPGAPVALGGAVEGDPYILPSLMTAVVLADLGFRALNLGPNVPAVAMLAAVRIYTPVLAWRCMSIPDAGALLRREIRQLEAQPASERAVIVVGGRGLDAKDLPARSSAQRLHSMAELAGFGRALLARS